MMMKKIAGFTLLELLITMAIIGIMASIAYPMYTDKIQKSRRADAQGALTQLAAAMERKFTETNSYCNLAATGGGTVTGCTAMSGATRGSDTGAPAFFAQKSPVDGTEKYYDLTISSVTVSGSVGTAFTLSATPANTQATDKCGTMTLTNTGVRSFTGTGVTAKECW
jgi:type IV pilus assembly protein PilE